MARASLLVWIRDNPWTIMLMLALLGGAFQLVTRVSAMEAVYTGEIRTHLQAAPEDHDRLIKVDTRTETTANDVAEIKRLLQTGR